MSKKSEKFNIDNFRKDILDDIVDKKNSFKDLVEEVTIKEFKAKPKTYSGYSSGSYFNYDDTTLYDSPLPLREEETYQEYKRENEYDDEQVDIIKDNVALLQKQLNISKDKLRDSIKERLDEKYNLLMDPNSKKSIEDCYTYLSLFKELKDLNSLYDFTTAFFIEKKNDCNNFIPNYFTEAFINIISKSIYTSTQVIGNINLRDINNNLFYINLSNLDKSVIKSITENELKSLINYLQGGSKIHFIINKVKFLSK